MKPLSLLPVLLAMVGTAHAQCPTETLFEPGGTIEGFGTSFSMPDGRVLVGASATGGLFSPHGAAFLGEYTPSGFEIEYGAGGREVDDATWQVETYDATSLWGHKPPGKPLFPGILHKLDA